VQIIGTNYRAKTAGVCGWSHTHQHEMLTMDMTSPALPLEVTHENLVALGSNGTNEDVLSRAWAVLGDEPVRNINWQCVLWRDGTRKEV